MTTRRTAGTRTVSRRRGGRPSREDAALLGERILDVATELFLAEGYGVTSIEAIAQRARISKRTFYHRFPDKAALFGAVIHRIIERLRPPADIPLFEGGNLDEILRRLARLILRAVLAPTALSLHRLLVAEGRRFPELAAAAAREGSRDEAVKQIAAMIDHEARASGRAVDRPQLAAEQFLEFVIAVPRRRALGLGTPMGEAELNAWADDCVALFLDGCRAGKSNPH
ncbi:MAG TPA: TetR/AcrR family transcriptional regulator [Stellaceae bacterium]|nr:TetR/AcrR family transcriptional regulator [Stellaceae bacterium]